MCGIAGIYSYHEHSPPVNQAELMRMRECMIPRGPDGAGLWFSDDQRVGLAHRRLAIIDLSPAGAQPMQDPESGNWIVFNGEIYNHVELRSQLNREGIVTRSYSDTEVLLKLYTLKGPAMLNMLRGMYAFAIWDARKRQMFLARDPFGIKPLYIADDGRTLRFASQVKALLAGQVDTRPEPAGHAGFLLWGSVPEPYTLYRGIRALLPGHWMCVEDGVVGQPVCFNSPTMGLRQTTSAGLDDTEAALHQIAKAVRDSVAAHMVADVPVGVFLSAGLDSTMLAACAASLGTLQTMTVGFEEYKDSIYDEALLAEKVAQRLGTQHTLHRISAADFAHDRELLLAAMDQPSIDGINTWFVARAAAKQGLKVALSGIGGDELFGSYPSFRQVPRLYKSMHGFSRVPLLGRAVRKGLSSISGVLPSPKHAGLMEYGGSLQGAYLLRRALFMPWEIGAFMDPDMAVAGLIELDTLACMGVSTDGISSERLAISALEMQWYMKNQLLRDADWAGMAHSLEIRVPFVDMTLLGQFVEIPSLNSMQEKAAIARIVAPELPEAVLSRPKTGFSVPIHQWLNPQAPNTISSHREWAQVLYQKFTNI
ncbi:MAG: asparagine synthase (glutamine-hydrolyzing) [Methylotenera sp.]